MSVTAGNRAVGSMRPFHIEPRVNRIAIPLAEVRGGPQTRVLDMSRIQRVSLLAVRPSVPFSFYLDGFRLDEEMSP
jgi:hypothetical protein